LKNLWECPEEDIVREENIPYSSEDESSTLTDEGEEDEEMEDNQQQEQEQELEEENNSKPKADGVGNEGTSKSDEYS